MRQQLPLWYSGLLTALILGIFVGQTRASVQVQRVEEIDVQRINVREPDGTLRMVIANRSRLPASSSRARSSRPSIAHRLACFSTTTRARRTAA